jgi:urease accessory protein
VYIVSSAASLLEGDELSIRIEVDADCHLTVRTVAAQMVHPCPRGGFASLHIDATLARGSTLLWQPEPTIVSGSADFRTSTHLLIGQAAKATWQDELIFGRTGELASSVRVKTRLHADLEGRPLLRDALDTTRPGSHGPAVLGDARYLGTLATLGHRNTWSDSFQLAGEGSLRRVVSSDIAYGRAALGTAAEAAGTVSTNGTAQTIG